MVPVCSQCAKSRRQCTGPVSSAIYTHGFAPGIRTRTRIHVPPVQTIDSQSSLMEGIEFYRLGVAPTQSSTAIFPLSALPLEPIRIVSLSEQYGLRFFAERTMPHMLRFTSAPGWIRAALQSSFQVRVVKETVLAVAFAHMGRRGAHMSGRGEFSPLQDRQSRSLAHYGNALRLLGRAEPPPLDIVLICCLLFHCYEHFAGRHLTAFKHIRGGMKLLDFVCVPVSQHQSKCTGPSSRRAVSTFAQSDVRPEIESIIQIPVWRDWESFILSDIDEPHVNRMDWIANSSRSFTNLTEARDNLDQILAVLSMSTESGADDTSSPTAKDLPHLLSDWLSAFSNFSTEPAGLLTLKPEPLLLEIHYTLAMIMHCSTMTTPFSESPIISLRPIHEQFEVLLQLCEVFIRSSSDNLVNFDSPWLGMDLGLIPPLFFTAIFSEDMTQRRTAIRLLHCAERFENIWNGCLAAKIAEGILELEQHSLADHSLSSQDASRSRISVLDVEKHAQDQIRLRYAKSPQPYISHYKVVDHASMPLDTPSVVWPIHGYLSKPGYQGLVLYRKARCRCFAV